MRREPSVPEADAPVLAAQASLKLVGRQSGVGRTLVEINDVRVGGSHIVVMAGPCAVENEEQLMETARAVKASGASVLRGGAFKPRTSPYSFQGLKVDGLRLLAQARLETGLSVVTEIMDPRQLDITCKYVDVLQVGSRNMQNYALLEEVGKYRKPVLLKRGMMATIEELLLAAEYVMKSGNMQIMLCERGIRTFETTTRNTMDLNAVPMLKALTHLPVIVDPSHGTGHWWMVPSLAKAAVAVGADGLLIEVHAEPSQALSDGMQALRPDRFDDLMRDLRPIAAAVGAELATPAATAVGS